jgi:hypothetical protein
MPCLPVADSAFSPPDVPGVDGFSPILPPLNIPYPAEALQDLGSLFNSLSLILPPGTLRPNFDPDYLDDSYGGINDLLGKFMPFLMLYKFFLPVLNLILCIIEVLCALLDPFKLPGAINRLFRQCIPEFLALFPFFALVIMIISLLLLMLTLIEYLVARIAQIIEIIVQNIILLGRATQRLEEDSIIGIVKKIGDLLCFLQNLFIIFGVFNAIIQIIKALLSLSFNIPPCDSSNGSSSGCCTPDVCPDFIKNNDTITSSTGNFLYYNQVGIDSGLKLPVGFPPIVSTIRNESWQFYDPNLSKRQAFINITNAYDLPTGTVKVFFPAGTSYNITTSPSSTPYTINFRFFYNPIAFNINDPKGPRYIKAVNVIVQNPPTAGVAAYDGQSFVTPFNGTLNLVGGVITEDDNTPILDSNGNTTPLNTFIHRPVDNSGILTNDGYLFSDLTYTLTINHEVLLGESLITLGCLPEVAINRDAINTTIGAQFNLNAANLANLVLPDVNNAQDCIINAINTFRQNISVESAATFQATVNSCLNDLTNQTTNALTSAITSSVDIYKSNFTIDPTIQFTTAIIQVSVSLNESSGQSIVANLPATSAATIAASLKGFVDLGNISNFSYDGYGSFIANITSDFPGNGTVKVAFNNNFISTLNNPTDITQPVNVSINELQYTFVQSSPFSSNIGGEPRRDSGDIAREGA